MSLILCEPEIFFLLGYVICKGLLVSKVLVQVLQLSEQFKFVSTDMYLCPVRNKKGFEISLAHVL